MLRALSFVIGAMLVVCGSSFGVGGRQQASGANSGTDANSQTAAKGHERAIQIYRRDCQVCHGVNGDGRTEILKDRDLALPDWTNSKSLAGKTDPLLFQVIRRGRGKMPAEAVGRADDDEVRNLIRYIRTMATEEAGVKPVKGPSSSPKN